MKIIKPSYYDTFRCIAGECPDSCCHQWQVQVDEEAAAFYRGLEGPLGDALRACMVDTESGTEMENVNDRCPMWRADAVIHGKAGGKHIVDLRWRTAKVMGQFVTPQFNMRVLAHQFLDKLFYAVTELRHKINLH